MVTQQSFSRRGRSGIAVVSAVLVFVVLGIATPLHSSVCVRSVEPVRGIRGLAITAAFWTDHSPSVLSGVTVKIRRGEFKATAMTDPDGYFSFNDLPQGDYELSASFEGFQEARETVQIRDGAAPHLVLVIELTASIDACGSFVRTESETRARRLQEQRSPAKQSATLGIENATPNPSLQRTPTGRSPGWRR